MWSRVTYYLTFNVIFKWKDLRCKAFCMAYLVWIYLLYYSRFIYSHVHQAQNHNLLCKRCDECFHDANSKMSASSVSVDYNGSDSLLMRLDALLVSALTIPLWLPSKVAKLSALIQNETVCRCCRLYHLIVQRCQMWLIQS